MTLSSALANAADKKATKALVVLCRLVVGAVFVFSGFVKGVDPWGSFYKFSEYFAAFGMQGMENVALFGAFAVAVVEFVLGVSVLLGAFRRGGVLLTGLMMLVMLPLTLYLALTDAVPDCGCFGDAVVISNWTTFCGICVVCVCARRAADRLQRPAASGFPSVQGWQPSCGA